ncbi:hypothetical protein PC117_g9911 [Phytophthora cactorum]|uniref:Uncharacterized protein n=1 Tax=Phytophthora cactorum TaxID=29920 RepID=A0A8T1DMD8_9STRA|nr:hypothetical protein PC117_g9911 [Phytophthora cactorum]
MKELSSRAVCQQSTCPARTLTTRSSTDSASVASVASVSARTCLCNKVWPHTSGRDIQNCEAGGGTGKRKRHRRSLNGEDVDESAENTADDEVTGSNTVGDVSGQGAVDDDAVHEDGAEENAADEAAAEERAAEENDENEDGA